GSYISDKRRCQPSSWTGVQKPMRKMPGLNGGHASVRARMDWQASSFGFARDFDGRMEKFRERLNAGNQARAGPRKVTVGFQRVHAAVSHRGHGIPLLGKLHRNIFVARLLSAVAARRDQQNFRLRLPDVLQMNAGG